MLFDPIPQRDWIKTPLLPKGRETLWNQLFFEEFPFKMAEIF
jgi:hypothetical protein